MGPEITMSGFTKEQYDRVMELLDFDAEPLEGVIFHCACQASGGWRVLDTWKLQSAFDQFPKNHLAPAFVKAGVLRAANPSSSRFIRQRG